jgi:hypothetical protein
LSLGEVAPQPLTKSGGSIPTRGCTNPQKVHMSYAKIGLDDLTVLAKIQYGRRLIAGITGHSVLFPDPNPSIAALTTETDAMEAAYNDAKAARLTAKTLTQILDSRERTFDGAVSQLASYVDNISNGDAITIERSGFSVRATPTPVGPLPAPTDLQVHASEHAGHADLRWRGSRGAVAFNIERMEDTAEGTWEFMATTTKREASVNSMISGKKYKHRVAAVGAAGQSAWSEPVSLVAP